MNSPHTKNTVVAPEPIGANLDAKKVLTIFRSFPSILHHSHYPASKRRFWDEGEHGEEAFS